MSLTVKAFLRKGPAGPTPPEYEIRRFGVDADVSSSFVYLVQKVTTVFPSLAKKTIELSWRDSENDLIAFSSDDELTEALSYVNDGVFKVYIEEKGEVKRETPETTSTPGVFHPHVTCDGCEGAIRGTRYKCTECPDYDLCSGCKSTGLHSDHKMITIEKPVSRPMSGRCPAFGPPPYGCFPHAPPGMVPPHGMVPPYGMGLPHGVVHPQGMGPPHGMVPPYGMGLPHGVVHPQGMGPPRGNAPQPPPPPPFCFSYPTNREEMRMQRRAWRRWMKSTCGADPCKMWKKEKKEEKKDEKKQDKRERKAERKAKKEAERAKQAEAAPGEAPPKVDKDSSSSSSSSDEGESSPTGDYLQSVGQSVAAMLDPLGIDVEIDVEHNGKRKHCQRGGPWGCHMRGNFRGHGWGRGRGGFYPMGFPFGGFAAAHAQAASAGCQFQGPPPPPEAQPYPQSHEMDTNSETGELRSGFQAPGCGVRTETAPSTDGEKAKASGSPEPNGWTLVIGDDEADVEEAASGVEKLQMSGPEVIKDSAQPPSIDVLLSEALEKMESMGYQDDDGWLAATLVDNSYDIGRTLDAINAKNKTA